MKEIAYSPEAKEELVFQPLQKTQKNIGMSNYT
jgi:hypothetical protein